MSTNQSRGERHFFGGTGFYIALFLCTTALAVAGYWTLLPHHHTADAPAAVTAPLPPSGPSMNVLSPRDDVPAEAEDDDPLPAARSESVSKPQTAEPALPFSEPKRAQESLAVMLPEAVSQPVSPPEPELIVPPLVGETVAAFSVSELSYNETLRDWRTHDGLDIAAEPGTQVLAACSGTVRSVADDDLMGTTVVLEHGGGYQTTYANLESVPTVAEGQYVSAGQVIGSVGQTALAESGEPGHLHFAVTKDGESVDPETFLND